MTSSRFAPDKSAPSNFARRTYAPRKSAPRKEAPIRNAPPSRAPRRSASSSRASRKGSAQIHRAQVGPGQHGGIENCAAHVCRLQAGAAKHRLVHQSELHIRLREAGVLEARRNEICPAQARARKIGIVEPRPLKHRADEVGPFQMGPGEIGSSEHSAIHLDPPQIEPREMNTRQIGRSEIGAAALAAFRLQIQAMAGEETLDLVIWQHANGVLSRKVESSKRRSWPIRFCHQAAFSNAPRHCVRGRFPLVASSRWHNLRAAYRGLTFWPSLCGRHANQPGLLLQRYSKPGEDREARPRSPSGGEGSGASSLPIARIGRLKASDC
jgi:hypothetical protein